MTTMERIKFFLERKVPVVIYWNDETGDPLWSVALEEDVLDLTNSFWLNAFETLNEAVQYCIANQLPYRVYDVNHSSV